MTSVYEGLICNIEGCNNPVKTKFLCNRHYKQTITYGKILTRTCIDKNEIIDDIEKGISKVFLYNRKREKIYEAIIDINQKEKIKQYIWTHHQYSNKEYIYAYNRNVGCMHRFLLNVDKKNLKSIIDHKNGNTLDNRLENLRLCSRQENSQNSKMRKNNKSGYKGIWFRKDTKKWGSSIKINEKTYYIGQFDTKEEAIEKYKNKVNELHGEFSYFNDKKEGNNNG